MIGFGRANICYRLHASTSLFIPSLTNESAEESRDSHVLEEKWKWDSGKCIDASPVVFIRRIQSEGEAKEEAEERVLIGSHSGLFACLRVDDGYEVWRVNLKSRIEATCSLTADGLYCVIGCYDGSVYFLGTENGLVHWRFETKEAVKTVACSDSLQPRIYIGSHDHNFYCLDFQVIFEASAFFIPFFNVV